MICYLSNIKDRFNALSYTFTQPYSSLKYTPKLALQATNTTTPSTMINWLPMQTNRMENYEIKIKINGEKRWNRKRK